MKKPGNGRGASRPGRAASARSGAKNTSAHSTPAKKGQPHRKRPEQAKVVFDAPVIAPEPRVFRLGVVPGATPGKWIGTWRERMTDVPLELVHVAARDANRALLDDEVDAMIMRPPVDAADLRSFALYDEAPVVVMSVDSALTAADELHAADLEGEVVIVADDDVLRIGDIPGTEKARFTLSTAADAVATVATGVGVTIVPMSIARANHRKDVEHRLYPDGPVAPVVLAWHADRETPDVQTFIGVVRGRTANSSRT